MKRQSLFITKKSWAYYERHCRGKIKHVAIHQAQTHVDDLKKKKPAEDFNYYVCRFCLKLHVGHVKTNPTVKEQALGASAGA